ncbi:MFS gliotoxin efflux transporter glia [Xylariaceae sp. FL0804]|nr:MFS gliotoxin efflux transporter glia [Xylariaceae sp. FL0804]
MVKVESSMRREAGASDSGMQSAREETNPTMSQGGFAQEESGDVEVSYQSRAVLTVVVIGLMLSMFLSIISTAIPSITSEFNSMEDIGWYGSAFFLTLAALQSFWGKAYKYYLLRGVFLAAIGVFEVGSLVCALAPNSDALIVGRAVQGAGGAGLTGGCYTIASFIAPPAKVNLIIGLLGSTFSLSSVAGPLLGGAFTQSLTWRWCFWINLPVGGVAVFCLLFFRSPAHSKTRLGLSARDTVLSMDLPGLVVVLGSLTCFFLALQAGGITRAWSSGTVVALLVLWLVFTVGWVILEWFQGDRALMVPRLFKSRHLAVCSVFIFFLSSANFSLIYNIPLYFQSTKGETPLSSGLLIIPTILSTSITTLMFSAIVGKVGFYQPFMVAGATLATIGAGLIYTWNLDTGLGRIIGYQIIYGVGTGLAVQVPVIVASTVTSAADQAVATATVLFFQFVSAAYGVGCTDSILNNLLLSSLPQNLPGVDPHEVLLLGASNLASSFQGDRLRGVRLSYLKGLHGSWALAIALFGVSFLAALASKGGGQLAPRQAPDGEKQQDKQRNGVVAAST